MATKDNKALRELHRLTECCICLNPFTDPRVLPCIHSACLECLEELQRNNIKNPGDVIPCPVCRNEFPIPPTGMSGLRKNFFVKNLLEITGNLNEEATFPQCPSHPLQVLNYYCGDCKAVVCVSCFVEKHKLHDCKDVTTVDKDFRKDIENSSTKMLHCIAQMEAEKRKMEHKRTNLLEQTSEIENAVRLKNQQLKAMIDRHTQLVLNELSSVNQRHLKEMETEIEEIELKMTILKSFETFCSEIKSKGSPTDVSSSVDGLIRRSDDLKLEIDEYLDRPEYVVDVTIKATEQHVLIGSSSNAIGQIEESMRKLRRSAIVIGGFDGNFAIKDVTKVNLHQHEDVSKLQQIPTAMQCESAAAVYLNSIYITGLGNNQEEIWKFDATSNVWQKCASMVKGRRRHSVAFVDQFLCICGGSVDSDGSVLNDVEAYDAINDRCSSVGKLVHCVHSSGNCVPFKSSLYIFGGMNANNEDMSHVQAYNIKSNTCTLLSHSMPLAASLMRAAVFEKTAILLGSDLCLLYDFDRGAWKERRQFRTEVFHFGMIIDNGQIFVIGGGNSTTGGDGKDKWTCTDDVICIPVMNIIEDKAIEWKHHAKLSKGSCVFSCEKIYSEL